MKKPKMQTQERRDETHEEIEKCIAKFKKGIQKLPAKERDQPSVKLLKKCFRSEHMPALWAKLKKARGQEKLTVREAWDTLSEGAGQNKRKLGVLAESIILPPGAWMGRLLEHVDQFKTGKKHSNKLKPMPFSELQQQQGELGAQACVDSGMYKKYKNKFGIEMVVKSEEQIETFAKRSKEIKKNPRSLMLCIMSTDIFRYLY